MSATRRDYVEISQAIREQVEKSRTAQSNLVIADRRNSDYLAGSLCALHKACMNIGSHFKAANPKGFDLARFMADSGFSQ